MKIVWTKRSERVSKYSDYERHILVTSVGIVDFTYSVDGGNLVWNVNGRTLNAATLSPAQAKRLVKARSEALLKAKTVKQVTAIMNSFDE